MEQEIFGRKRWQKSVTVKVWETKCPWHQILKPGWIKCLHTFVLHTMISLQNMFMLEIKEMTFLWQTISFWSMIQNAPSRVMVDYLQGAAWLMFHYSVWPGTVMERGSFWHHPSVFWPNLEWIGFSTKDDMGPFWAFQIQKFGNEIWKDW